jgi:hypothetical protein
MAPKQRSSDPTLVNRDVIRRRKNARRAELDFDAVETPVETPVAPKKAAKKKKAKKARKKSGD